MQQDLGDKTNDFFPCSESWCCSVSVVLFFLALLRCLNVSSCLNRGCQVRTDEIRLARPVTSQRRRCFFS